MSTANDKPFVFISYAHANSDRVLPILRAMQESDICLWYDGGIEAGSEWPEYIAERVIFSRMTRWVSALVYTIPFSIFTFAPRALKPFS